MAPSSKSVTKNNPGVPVAESRKHSSDQVSASEEIPENVSPNINSSLQSSIAKLTLSDYIYSSLEGDTVGNLIGLSDTRDELIKESTAGLYPDVITGCVDISMAIMEAQFKLADSLEETRGNEELSREKVLSFILSVLDAVYGPNCVRITVYNPDVDWNISLWQMFPVSESPSSRNFLALAPPQGDTVIQWMDLKSQLIKQCRNPKQEAQRREKISALEDELQELALKHATLINRFIKIQQGEKDPDAAQLRRDEMKQRLAARKQKLAQLIAHLPPVDPAVRTKRDAILWGGPPHVGASTSLNNSTMSAKAGSSLVRRLSIFGFRDEEDFSDQDSSPPDEDHLSIDEKKANVGCLGFFRRPKCCL